MYPKEIIKRFFSCIFRMLVILKQYIIEIMDKNNMRTFDKFYNGLTKKKLLNYII